MATHIRDITVELRRESKVKAQAHKAENDKGILDLIETNITYILRLSQLYDHEDPPIWKELAGGPQHKHLTTLKWDLDDITCRLSSPWP